MDANKYEEFWRLACQFPVSKLNQQSLPYVIDCIQMLIQKCLSEERFDIGIMGSSDNKKWSLISYDNLDTDKQFSLRYSENDFDLYLSIYNDDQEDYINFSHLLTEEEVATIPEGLQILMKRALEIGGLVAEKGVLR